MTKTAHPRRPSVVANPGVSFAYAGADAGLREAGSGFSEEADR